MLGGRKTVICEFLGTGMISVMPVLLYQFIHGNVANKVIFDMYPLFAFSAGLVRCLHINSLYKLSESVWRKFREVSVSAYPLNKLLKVFYLSFLYFDFFCRFTISALSCACSSS